jgi:hypothetical protein
MGRAAVRAAIQAALTKAGVAGTIPHLGTVYAARAYIAGTDFEFNQARASIVSPQGSSCVAVVNIPSNKRERRALVGRSAVNDTNIHHVQVELYFANISGTPVVAQQEYDQVVDGMFVEIRNNPNLSATTTVWSAGEYTAGVTHTQSAPDVAADGMTVFIYGVVSFEAWEWVAGSNV